ncbi:MAG: hypothetical protein QOD93_4033 [Acetobacteraceae bacterium]|nr:hypothetical protein [Acetobacteraceae bacterium]
MTTDGGAVASYGFRRQYLATAEEVLRLVVARREDIADLAVIIEPARADLPGADVVDDDVVDFAVEIGGEITRRIQVKSSRAPSAMNPLRYSDAAPIFSRMGTGAHEVVILTNKPLAKKLLGACSSPTVSADGEEVYAVTASAITSGSAIPARLIVRDNRTVADIKRSVLELVREIRRDNAIGPGEQSAAMLTSMLLDRMFEAAADLSPRRWSAREVVDLLCLPDNQIAHARRHYDWGVPLNEVPRLVSAVARTNVLSSLTDFFNGSVTRRTPTVAVLAGTTGFGKSTIAADFCHLNRHLYEYVCWIDARSPDLLEAWVRDRVKQMGIEVDEGGDVGAAFRTVLARIGGPFVVVFDGAVRRQDIEPFLPTSGCGFVIVTTTNSTGWWHTAKPVPVGSFNDEEAIACFEAYAGIDPGTHATVITTIVRRLGHVPLAIAMAASYFRNADEDVSLLSEKYFDSLAALDDDMAVPDDFDKTAFAAVRFAVEQMGSAEYGDTDFQRESQLLVYHSAFFAPELIPVNMVLQTVASNTVALDLASPPRPVEADQHVRNRILTNLRTQTIARRRTYLDASRTVNPASDTINIHPLVHRILREIHMQAAPQDSSIMNLVAVFMGHLYGWIVDLRPSGAFFTVEQLLVHAQWMLDFANETITIPTDADSQQAYAFRCAVLYLKSEVANCHSSRGDYARGVELIEQALEEFAIVEAATFHPQCAAAKAACDAIADAEVGGLGEHRALPLAARAIDALTKIEQFTDPPGRDRVIYQLAVQAAQAVNRFGTTETRSAAEQLDEIASRNQPSTPQEIDKINQIDQFLKTGRYPQALALIQITRGANPTAYQRVMFDNFEIIANLHLHRFDVAADGIDRILSAAAEGTHMRTHVDLARVEIEEALQATQPAWAGRSRRLAARRAALRDL